MLEIDGLVRSYGDVRALDGMTFTVKPGTVTGFLGPNGAGKTTTMRAIFDLTVLDAGEVRWGGDRIDRDARRRFGYLPEERGLYPKMSVIDQIVYFGRLRGLAKARARSEGIRRLEELGLADRAGDKLEGLSLGNQQRVQLICCLLHEPDVLVLDEPFSGLDPVAVKSLSDVLVSQATGGATVMFSSHQLDLVQDLCEWAVIVDRGRVVVDGSIDDLTAGADQVLVVDVPSDPAAGWLAALEDVVVDVISNTNGRVRLSMHGDGATTVPRDDVTDLPTDDDPAQRVLDAARAAGPVRHFAFERRTLAEVFLAEVGRPIDTDDVTHEPDDERPATTNQPDAERQPTPIGATDVVA